MFLSGRPVAKHQNLKLLISRGKWVLFFFINKNIKDFRIWKL